MQRVQCKIAPSLGGGFEGSPNDVWGTVDYTNDNEPCIFFGMYGLPDFYSLWKHKGKKYILWAGSDIRHLANGYWLEDGGDIRIESFGVSKWINRYCESFVENEVEQKMLKDIGIESKIVPSFLGDINKFDISFIKTDPVKLYTSVSGDDFDLYGWYDIQEIAEKNPDVEFHLYGNKRDFNISANNVFVHGRVSKEQMNEETKSMTGALRLTEFDGFSEILCKSILWGQYPVSRIKYPFMFGVDDIPKLKELSNPNIDGREYFKSIINKYPWKYE